MTFLKEKENNLKLIKKLVFILILFAFGFMLNTNTVKADTVKEAYLKKGAEVQNKLRSLITDYLSDPIFRKATFEEYNEVKDTLNSKNIISADDSPYPVYGWPITIDDKINIVYYSEADKIYLNPNSSKMFYVSGYYSIYFSSIDISGLDASKAVDLSYMFSTEYGNELHRKRIVLGDFNAINAENVTSMFAKSSSLTSLEYSHFILSNKVTSLETMFTTVKVPHLDLSGFDTSNVTSMKSMFAGATIDTIDVGGWDTSKVTDMTRMFQSATINYLNLNSFNTSSLTNTYGLFEYSDIETLDISGFDTSNVQNMSYMFSNMKYKINPKTSIDVHSINTSNATNMDHMFFNNRSITELDISSFDTSKVTNMDLMFSDCVSLERIYVGDSFNTDSVTTSTKMFYGSSKLVGQKETKYNSNKVDVTYAKVDDPDNGNPGYLTYREYKPRVYYPDGTYEEVEIGTIFTLPSSYSKADEDGATVTLNPNFDGANIKYSNVKKHYILNNWNIKGTSYNPGETFVVNFDTYLEPNYVEVLSGADLSPTRRLDYKFL
jgi:surface protein